MFSSIQLDISNFDNQNDEKIVQLKTRRQNARTEMEDILIIPLVWNF